MRNSTLLNKIRIDPMKYYNMLTAKERDEFYIDMEFALGEDWDEYSELKTDELIDKTNSYELLATYIRRKQFDKSSRRRR